MEFGGDRLSEFCTERPLTFDFHCLQVDGASRMFTRLEALYIESVLRRTNWIISAAARLLEIQRSYLHQKIADLQIERPAE